MSSAIIRKSKATLNNYFANDEQLRFFNGNFWQHLRRTRTLPHDNARGSLDQSEWIKDGLVMKYCPGHHDQKFCERRLVLTHENLFISRGNPGDELGMIDLIPLADVLDVEKRSHTADCLFDRHATHSLASRLPGKRAKTSGDNSLHEMLETRPEFRVCARSGTSKKMYYFTANQSADSEPHQAQIVDEWVEAIGAAQKAAIESHKKQRRIATLQEKIHAVYAHTAFQFLVAFMIATNFIVSAYELQTKYSDRLPGSSHDNAFKVVDFVFAIIFLVELLINMSANWFWEFWRYPANWFDLVVVLTTFVSLMLGSSAESISVLRLVRSIRVACHLLYRVTLFWSTMLSIPSSFLVDLYCIRPCICSCMSPVTCMHAACMFERVICYYNYEYYY